MLTLHFHIRSSKLSDGSFLRRLSGFYQLQLSTGCFGDFLTALPCYEWFLGYSRHPFQADSNGVLCLSLVISAITAGKVYLSPHVLLSLGVWDSRALLF